MSGGEIREDLDGPHLRQALLEATGSARDLEKPSERRGRRRSGARRGDLRAAMRIFDNLLYKIVALLIACVLWAAAQGVDRRRAELRHPVQVESVPDGLWSWSRSRRTRSTCA